MDLRLNATSRSINLSVYQLFDLQAGRFKFLSLNGKKGAFHPWLLFTVHQCQAGGSGGHRAGLWNFSKNCCKISYPGQKCEVKYNCQSPTREMICGHGHKQKFKYPYLRDSKIIQMPYPRTKAIDPMPPPPSPPPPPPLERPDTQVNIFHDEIG